MSVDYRDESARRDDTHRPDDFGHGEGGSRPDAGGQHRGGPYRGGHRGGGGHPRGGGRGERRERRGIPLSVLDPATTAASRKAIGASIEIHRALGPGYSQAVYLAALRLEFDAMGVRYKVDHAIPVVYKDKQLGTVTADMLVEERFALHVLSRPGPVTTIDRLHLRGQLRAANIDLGLIINFAERRLKDGLVRVLNVEKITREKGILLDEHDEAAEHHEFEDRPE